MLCDQNRYLGIRVKANVMRSESVLVRYRLERQWLKV